jgi:2-keto-4-pentenoate hydratase/2-oxohepta-3-ene-1,7-dioic acid hydratase in catechol pathway
VRILRFDAGGGERTGLLAGDEVVDVSARDPELDDLRRAVTVSGQARLAGMIGPSGGDHRLADVTLLAPVHPEARLFCVGKNFRDHAAEVGGPEPAEPRVFLRTHQSLVGPGGRLTRPQVSECFDYEGEVALVIGAPAARAHGAGHGSAVAAFTCMNDGSIRDYQQHTTTAGKNIGPWLVTADEVGDPSALEVTTTLNGEQVQRGVLRDLIYPISAVISYLSSITTLLPGDVVSLGTPAGVGKSRNPPRWLVPGDALEVEVSRVGVLRMTVGSEA